MMCPLCNADLEKNGQRGGIQRWKGHTGGCRGENNGRPPVEPDPTPAKRLDRHRRKRGVTPRVCRYAVYAEGKQVATVEARSVFGARKLAGDGAVVKLIPRRDWDVSKSSIKKGDRVLCYYPNAAVEPSIVTVLDVDSNAATETKLAFFVEVPGNGRCRLDSFWIDSIRESDRDEE